MQKLDPESCNNGIWYRVYIFLVYNATPLVLRKY